jgi:hypothetical protein
MKRNNIESSQSEFICDNCNHDKEYPAYSQLALHFWYGSKNDMKQGNIHLCDECAENMIYLVKKEFGIKNFLTTIEEF